MILQQYNDVAAHFSEVHEERNKESIDAYFTYFDFPVKGQRVLDLGCGDGYDLLRLQERGAIAFGIDISNAMITIAMEKNPQGQFSVSSFETLPFEDASFDLVISKWALQNAENPDRVYDEVARVLKDGGRFIYLTSHPTRQFLEKKYKGKNYFQQELVETIFFDGLFREVAPSHTMCDYLSPKFFHYFYFEMYHEGYDSGSEKVDGDTFPSYFILKSCRKTRTK